VEAERYLSDCVLIEHVGNKEDLDKSGVNASRGPREGVVAVRFPEGVAVRNVPLIVSLPKEGEGLAQGGGGLTCLFAVT
jgi:hypothetical protein